MLWADELDIFVQLIKLMWLFIFSRSLLRYFFLFFFHFFYIMVCWLDGWTINLSIGSRIPLRYFKVCLLFFPLIVMIKTCARNQLICLPSFINTMFEIVINIIFCLKIVPSHVGNVPWVTFLYKCHVWNRMKWETISVPGSRLFMINIRSQYLTHCQKTKKKFYSRNAFYGNHLYFLW